MQDIIFQAIYLVFQDKGFPRYSSQGTLSILYRVFGQGGTSFFDLTLFSVAKDIRFLSIGRDHL